MRVKLNYTTVYGPIRYEEGREYDVDCETARVMIEGKMARAVRVAVADEVKTPAEVKKPAEPVKPANKPAGKKKPKK